MRADFLIFGTQTFQFRNTYQSNQVVYPFVIPFPPKTDILFQMIDPKISIIKYVNGWEGLQIFDVRQEILEIINTLKNGNVILRRQTLVPMTHTVQMYSDVLTRFTELYGCATIHPQAKITVVHLDRKEMQNDQLHQ